MLQQSGESLSRITTFSVFTPPPGGGTSDPLELEIADESGSAAQPQ